MSDASVPLPFTGERFTPECVREIWYEHIHRYAFASRFVHGKRVLDAACGEGYGTALLARVAEEAVGVDIDAASVAHARERYAGVARARFERSDAAALQFADKSFDYVVSFETIEHLAAQEELVAGFARVLTDDGLLIISSPDKRTYSEVAGFRNEFHVRELYREEFEALLRRHFRHVELYGQKLLFQSVLWSLADHDNRYEALTAAHGGQAVAPGLDHAPLYFVAICSQRELALAAPGISLFGDREETVYAHYNHEIRKNMSAGERIVELERELAEARARAAQAPSPQPTLKRWWKRNGTPK